MPEVAVAQEKAIKLCEEEGKDLLQNTSSAIWYVHKDGSPLTSTITASILEICMFIKSKAALLWRIFKQISPGIIIKPNAEAVIKTAILILLNCRNQQLNAFQIMGNVLYTNRLSEGTVEIPIYMAFLGLSIGKSCTRVMNMGKQNKTHMALCASYFHINTVSRSLVKDLKKQEVKRRAS